jgi:hypothetical protein
VTVSWFRPQNQVGYGLLVVPQNQREDEDGAGRDLAACFAWKRVGLGFSSLTSRLAEARCGWCMWHYREDRMDMKSKTDGSMRWAVLVSSIPTL